MVVGSRVVLTAGCVGVVVGLHDAGCGNRAPTNRWIRRPVFFTKKACAGENKTLSFLLILTQRR